MNMFVDRIKIEVYAGESGDGMAAFHREEYVPNDGPVGDDGDHGGNIILKADGGLRILMDFRYHRIFKAKNGGNGMSEQMTGLSAEDTVIAVPQGTTVRDLDTGEITGDLVEKDQELVVAKGGRDGHDNTHFTSAKNPAPEIAENGEPGEGHYLELELKMLADAGLIEFPSVGKSTLLSVVTGVKPKITAYEFTTLTPNLGVAVLPDGRDFTMTDMPSLIKGASKGIGLGLKFLRHIERTHVLLHLVDMSSEDPHQTIERYRQINEELVSYDPGLLKRSQIVVVTKMDLPDSANNLAAFKADLTTDKTLEKQSEIFPISAITHQGVQQLMQLMANLLSKTPAFGSGSHDRELVAEYRAAAPNKKDETDFTIIENEDGTWVLGDEKLIRLFKMTDLTHEESQLRFAHQLRHMGVDGTLRAKSVQDGDLVRIEKFVLEFIQ